MNERKENINTNPYHFDEQPKQTSLANGGAGQGLLGNKQKEKRPNSASVGSQ